MARITRRRFLEDSLWVATAALAAEAIPGIARAQEAPEPAKKASPNERVRVCCIGVRAAIRGPK